MHKVLEGIRAIEFGIAHAGPGAGYIMADLGAEVIRLEDPFGQEQEQRARSRNPERRRFASGVEVKALPFGLSPLGELTHRGKKAIAIDLRQEKGREVVYDLVRNSDVFYTNFRKDVRIRRGLDYDTLKKVNPKIIYGVTSAYGELGPEAKVKGFDNLGMARSGFMWQIGEPDMPPQAVSFGTCDQATCTFLAFGIISALFARERFGIGQEVDVSLTGSMIHLQPLPINNACLLDIDPPRVMPQKKAFNPLVNFFPAGPEGRDWIQFSENSPQPAWPKFCEALGKPEWITNEYATTKGRGENCEKLIREIEEILKTKTRDEWLKIFWEKDLVVTALTRSHDLVNDPQCLENQYIVELDHPILGKTKHLGYPIRFHETPAQATPGSPMYMGQHTEEVLRTVCGYSEERIADLKAGGIVGVEEPPEGWPKPTW